MLLPLPLVPPPLFPPCHSAPITDQCLLICDCWSPTRRIYDCWSPIRHIWYCWSLITWSLVAGWPSHVTPSPPRRDSSPRSHISLTSGSRVIRPRFISDNIWSRWREDDMGSRFGRAAKQVIRYIRQDQEASELIGNTISPFPSTVQTPLIKHRHLSMLMKGV